MSSHSTWKIKNDEEYQRTKFWRDRFAADLKELEASLVAVPDGLIQAMKESYQSEIVELELEMKEYEDSKR